MEARITGQSADPSLDETIVSQARALNSDLSRAVKTECERLWRLENAEAIAEMNEHIDENGLPLAEFRQF